MPGTGPLAPQDASRPEELREKAGGRERAGRDAPEAPSLPLREDADAAPAAAPRLDPTGQARRGEQRLVPRIRALGVGHLDPEAGVLLEGAPEGGGKPLADQLLLRLEGAAEPVTELVRGKVRVERDLRHDQATVRPTDR
jgi:hypothetical protein